MYARRFYRKPPPGYSGIAFAPAVERQETPPLAEEGGLSLGQRNLHQKEKRRLAPLGVSFDGQKLAPILRGEEGGVMFEREKEKVAITMAEPAKAAERGNGEDLILIGCVLFLLGTGLDEESVLVLLAVLILLS